MLIKRDHLADVTSLEHERWILADLPAEVVLDRIPDSWARFDRVTVRRAVGAASDSESPSTPRSPVVVAARCPTIDVQGAVLESRARPL